MPKDYSRAAPLLRTRKHPPLSTASRRLRPPNSAATRRSGLAKPRKGDCVAEHLPWRQPVGVHENNDTPSALSHGDSAHLQEAAALADRKAGKRVAMCLPALNEAATIGVICDAVRKNLMSPDAPPLVDELWVLHESEDNTPQVAAEAGAKVADVRDLLGEVGPGHGKGNALWKAMAVTAADIIVYCDADLLSFSPGYVTKLLSPFLETDDAHAEEEIVLVKGCYQRWLNNKPEGGGRTTELVARPLLAMFFPELSHIRQPLSGEYAVLRSAAMQVPFVQGYGVEVGLLIDLSAKFGAGSITQVDLGVRLHRNRPLHELAPQALEIMQVVLERAGVEHPSGIWETLLPDERNESNTRTEPKSRLVSLRERPPMENFCWRERSSQKTAQPQPLVAPQVEQA